MWEENERCCRRLSIFYAPYFPSLPRQDRTLVKAEVLSEPEWHFIYSYIFQERINKEDSSTSINANYVQKQFAAEWWNGKIYLNSHQNKNVFAGVGAEGGCGDVIAPLLIPKIQLTLAEEKARNLLSP